LGWLLQVEEEDSFSGQLQDPLDFKENESGIGSGSLALGNAAESADEVMIKGV
jgi:hypothetical protein